MDGYSSARNTKCIFIIYYYCCDGAASAEGQRPDGEMLQPMAFPKGKGKNQAWPWTSGRGYSQSAGRQGLHGLPGVARRRWAAHGRSKLKDVHRGHIR